MHKNERNTCVRNSQVSKVDDQTGGGGVVVGSTVGNTIAMALPTKTYRRPRLVDVNAGLTCILCNGYFINATTITECLHSFCKSCIVKYLEANKCCPICEKDVGTKPLQSIRSDKILQDIVYKLIPDVFQNEMHRRRDFYIKHTEEMSTCAEDRGEVIDHRMFYMANDKISLSLEYGYGDNQMPDNTYNTSPTEETPTDNKLLSIDENDTMDTMKRYLLCPAGLSILHLKKFIFRKYGLPESYRVDVMYLQDILSEDIMLMDVAYIYNWKRSDPMRLFYRISERPIKRLKTTQSQNIESKSGSGGSGNSDISNANNHNNNNSVNVSQSKLVGAHPTASSRTSQTSTTTIIMTGAAPVPTSSYNSSANGVTSNKASLATPKHMDTYKGNTSKGVPPHAVKTPQAQASKRKITTSVSAVQTDEPSKKLRKVLPTNNMTASTPNKANCANTSAPTVLSNTSTSTVNSLRQCRIHTDKSKLSTSNTTSANNTKSGGICVTKISIKEDIKDNTKCANNANDSNVTTKKTSNRKSSAFDVRTLIGTKSPTLAFSRHTDGMIVSDYNDSNKSVGNMTFLQQNSKQSKGCDGNAIRDTSSQCVMQSSHNKKTASITSKSTTTPNQTQPTHCSHSIGIKISKSGVKSLKNNNNISVKSNTISNKDMTGDSVNKTSGKAISGTNAGPQTESITAIRQSTPLSPTSIRIKLSPPPPLTTSINSKANTGSCNKNSAKSSTTATNTSIKTMTLPVAPQVQTNHKNKESLESIFGVKECDVKLQRLSSDVKINNTIITDNKCVKSIDQIGNNSLTKSSKTKGASINQIVNKIASGVTSKSASVNVTSTTPTLQLNHNSTGGSQNTFSTHVDTSNEGNDNRVSVTTGESGVGSSFQNKNQCAGSESAIKSVSSSTTNSGNLVIRISTKTNSVESIVSPKDKSSQKINNKCETKRDLTTTSASTNNLAKSSTTNTINTNASSDTNTANTPIDCKTSKTCANDSVNDITNKVIKKENDLKVNINEEEDDEDDDEEDSRKLVVDVPNEDSGGNDGNSVKNNPSDKDNGIKHNFNNTLMKNKVQSNLSTKLAINIGSATRLSANCAVLTSPPPTPTPSPKSESDHSITNDTKPNAPLNNGPLDLSMSTKKDKQLHPKMTVSPVRAIYDIPPPKPKQCVNPAVLDKHRSFFPNNSAPKQQFPSFKIMNTQGMRSGSSSSHSLSTSNMDSNKKKRPVVSPMISSTGNNHLTNKSQQRSTPHSHHHNHKNYSVISPEPNRFTTKIPNLVIRNISSPPSITSHFNYPTHH
ncbi:probable serine/threonine-protein kinase nek3 [Oppia nitens]|uniref:probable serine/threonine-protein kinase nek3 n=1 Tax=Oppia nitens TaxID=1686743 RepID=UPI0023D9C1BA|nr:probable serine/threonine-protein kinase nek3 [Oppia nitens]